MANPRSKASKKKTQSTKSKRKTGKQVNIASMVHDRLLNPSRRGPAVPNITKARYPAVCKFINKYLTELAGVRETDPGATISMSQMWQDVKVTFPKYTVSLSAFRRYIRAYETTLHMEIYGEEIQ